MHKLRLLDVFFLGVMGKGGNHDHRAFVREQRWGIHKYCLGNMLFWAISRASAAKDPCHQHKLRNGRKRPPKLDLGYNQENDRKAKQSKKKPVTSKCKSNEKEDGVYHDMNVIDEDDDDATQHDDDDGDEVDDQDYEAHSSDESNYSNDEEKIIAPVAISNEAAIKGHDVFGFQTPRRAGSLAQAAAEALHVPKGKTPKSAVKGNQTSKAKQVGKDKKIIGKRTGTDCPRPVVTARLLNESDDDLSGVSSEDEESPKPFSRDDLHSEDPAEMVQEYFSAHHSSKCLTSDRTLASLGTPLMDQEELSRHLQQVSATHQDECVKLFTQHRKSFPKWIFQIRHGFNLLLYGLGSKRVLIDQFRTSMLQGTTQLVVNGFFPSITIKHILNTITEEVLEHKGTFKSVIDQTAFVRDMFTKGRGPGNLYLIIHNIDGPMLRSKKTQTILSLLAEAPYIHMIASIDHINAPLVWDQSMCSRFRWLWNDVSTFEPYVEETSYENSLLVQQSGALALSSLTHVMRSLTPNGREIFLIIVKQQLLEKDNSSYIGFGIRDLYTKCREAFLVNSEQTLRSQLTEFRDHKLIRSKKGPDGVECLHIPLDAFTLKQFLEDHEGSNK